MKFFIMLIMVLKVSDFLKKKIGFYVFKWILSKQWEIRKTKLFKVDNLILLNIRLSYSQKSKNFMYK